MKRLLNNISLKNKLLIISSILIIIPIIIISTLFYTRSSSIIEGHMNRIINIGLDQTKNALTYKFSKMVNTANSIAINTEIQSILRRGQALYDKGKQLEDLWTLNKIIEAAQYDGDIYRVRIFVHEGLIYSNEGYNILNISTIENDDWYQILFTNESKDKSLWKNEELKSEINFAEKVEVFTYFKLIKDLYNYNDIIGVVAVDILRDDAISLLNQGTFSDNSYVFLKDRSQNLLFASDNSIADYALNIYPSDKSGTLKQIDERLFIVNHKKMDDFNLILDSLMPINWLQDSNTYLRNYIILILFIVLIIAVLIAYIFSNSSFKRINEVIYNMKKVQDGNTYVQVKIDGNDEIGEVERNFNFMINKINSLIEEKYELGVEAKNAELKALQAQINPHFLYNTLDMINWMVMDYEPKETSKLIKTLSEFYKLSLGKGKEFVQLRTELHHVTLYIEIQNLRYGNNIALITEIQEGLEECKIFKLILQPLVENSIIHGIMATPEKKGTVTIKAASKRKTLTISIKDDGIGMSKDKLDNILKEDTSETHGYGVRNINERIKLKFGSKYGLTYSSLKSQGTEVIIKLPITY